MSDSKGNPSQGSSNLVNGIVGALNAKGISPANPGPYPTRELYEANKKLDGIMVPIPKIPPPPPPPMKDTTSLGNYNDGEDYYQDPDQYLDVAPDENGQNYYDDDWDTDTLLDDNVQRAQLPSSKIITLNDKQKKKLRITGKLPKISPDNPIRKKKTWGILGIVLAVIILIGVLIAIIVLVSVRIGQQAKANKNNANNNTN